MIEQRAAANKRRKRHRGEAKLPDSPCEFRLEEGPPSPADLLKGRHTTGFRAADIFRVWRNSPPRVRVENRPIGRCSIKNTPGKRAAMARNSRYQ